MFTISGRNVEVGGYPPSVHDVAWNLSRIPRWAGATIHPWSVAQHSLMMERAASWSVTETGRLWALWHDAHEFATGDIPVPFKASEQRKLQTKIQGWLYTSGLGLTLPSKEIQTWVKQLDRLCVVAEGYVLCHPLVAEHMTESNGFGTDTRINPNLIGIIVDMLDMSQREACDLFVQKTDELVTLVMS